MNREHYIAGDWGTSREAPYLPCHPVEDRDGFDRGLEGAGAVAATCLDGEQCVLAGLRTLWRQ